MSAKAIAKALGGCRAGAGCVARCPAHDDCGPSLSTDSSSGPNAVKNRTVIYGAAPADLVTPDFLSEYQSFGNDEGYPNGFGEEPNSRDPGEGVVVISRTTQDRAAVAAIAIEQIFATAQMRERRQAVEDYIREEFVEVQRRAIADREPVDA
jgi:hypothetical protein